MGEKLNLILIIILFAIFILGVYFEYYKISEKTIVIENKTELDYSGGAGVIAECPSGKSVVSGGCFADGNWLVLNSFGPIKAGEKGSDFNFKKDGWYCLFYDSKEPSAPVWNEETKATFTARAICK